jgi:tetratricopeptide (TPR) repeat protein
VTREEAEEAIARLAANGDHEAACRVAAEQWRQWLTAGDIPGGRRLLATALAGDGPPSRARALALYGDGLLAFRAGEQEDSKARNEAALEVARAAGDKEAESLALVGLSRVALRDHDYARVRSLAAQARELARSLDPSADVMPLHLLAAGTRLSGELDEAVALYNESLELNRSLGSDHMVGVEHHNLGHVELHRGNVDDAQRHFAECQAGRSSDDPYDVAMTDLNGAALAFAGGRRDEAAELLARAESILGEAGIALDPDDRFEVDWLHVRL